MEIKVSKWKDVGDWISDNAGTGASLVGSLLTGNVAGAVAAGVSLVSGATGTNNPDMAMAQLQNNPESLVKLKELYYKNEDSVRKHIETMERIKLEDEQAAHKETQETIRNGDNAKSIIVRTTRPLQSWASLIGAIVYISLTYDTDSGVDVTVLGLLLTLPWAYAGLREVGKGVEAYQTNKVNKTK